MKRSILPALLCPIAVLLAVFGGAPSLFAQSNEDCLGCHADPDLGMRRNGREVSLFLDEARFGASVHKGLQCVECHVGYEPFEIPHIDPDKESPVGRKRQPKTCLRCHLDDPEVRARVPASAGFVAAYGESVHGMALQAGELDSATCGDCHGHHDVLPPGHPDSMLSRRNVNRTCGRCHARVHEEYVRSTHGEALRKGARGAPTCTSCHGEHTIFAHDDPRSPVSAVRLATDVCAQCHEPVRVTDRYGLTARSARTYVESYHGLAVRAGGVNVANCASCHGSHDILPSQDPRSLVHKGNLAETCGACHPGATENFARGRVHLVGAPGEDRVIYWISSIYLVLIMAIVGGMLVHNMLDLNRKMIVRVTERASGGAPHAAPAGPGLYLRLTLGERLQHASMMVSFPVLVVTGFMLSYPDAWWVAPFRDSVPGFYDLRRLLHQAAAVVMVAGCLYHLYHVIFTRRGRELVRDLRPRVRDLRDALALIRYNIGFSKERPMFDRFSYIEKAEYWALVWGSALMVFTGFVLWFETAFINLAGFLFYDVSRVIHFYEAWLAVLSIVVWHLYFVIFNPDVYPMNPAWLTGTLTEEEMMHEHPLELERIRRTAGPGGRTQVTPPPEPPAA